jgi:hypothetical protein
LSLNHNTALQVCKAFISSSPNPETEDLNHPRPFIYISAEDIFRPLIPAGYIERKREAEQEIEGMIKATSSYRAVYIRPSAFPLLLSNPQAKYTLQGLVYHAHYRPLTTPAATLLDLSATLHRKVPQGIPTPSSVIRTLASTNLLGGGRGTISSSLESIANAFVIPPIHVDQVAEAICTTLDSRSGIKGVVDTRRMRELIGWPEEEGKSSLGLAE